MARTSTRPLIAVISQVPPPVHGQTAMTVRLLESLDVLGHPVRFVDRRFSRTIAEVGVPSVRKALGVFGLLARTIAMLVRWRPTATVFFVTTRPGSFLVDWLLSELLRMARGRVVLYVHSVGFRDLAARGPLWRVVVSRFFGPDVEVVCLGASLTADVRSFVSADRVSCIANTPVDEPIDAARAARTTNVLFLSNLIAGKGAERFARIACRLADARPTWTFTMAGHAGDERVLAEVESCLQAALGAPRITRPGPLGGAAKWQSLRDATCLAFTSELVEAQPLTIVEALACGTPVVAHRVGGVVDLIEDGVNGYLVDVGDEATFADRVCALGDDAELRSAMSAAALAKFDAELSPEAYTGSWARLLAHDTAAHAGQGRR